MELRETYYEVYLNGGLEFQGAYEDCRDIALHALDDDCAEIYKVTITEEKVVL
jgi:hypothetical protein